MVSYLGNQELLKRHKIAFFASSKTKSASVLPTLDWATEIAKREDIAVCSGFQSPLELEILSYLLNGKAAIIVCLNRSIYKTIPKKYLPAWNANRILFISLLSEGAVMPNRYNAQKRNLHLAELADELVFASISPESSLHNLYLSSQKPKSSL